MFRIMMGWNRFELVQTIRKGLNRPFKELRCAKAVGQCNYAPPVIRNPHVVPYLRRLGFGLVSLISSLGDALGVVG